jgi:hypothetical protein
MESMIVHTSLGSEFHFGEGWEERRGGKIVASGDRWRLAFPLVIGEALCFYVFPPAGGMDYVNGGILEGWSL